MMRWTPAAEANDFWPLAESLLDATDSWPAAPRRADIERVNRGRAEALRRLVLPLLVRHVYPAYRVESAPPTLPEVVAEAGLDSPESRVAHIQTPRGELLVRDICPPSLLEHLHPDPGLIAFTRRPHQEHAISTRVATTGRGSVAVAHTQDGAIVAQVVLTPADDWWRNVPRLYELTIETSKSWRRLGIARRLLAFCTEPAWIEHLIVLAMGLDWHWDLEGTGLDARTYGQMLRRLFEPVGFRVLRSSERNVAMHASNLLLVRVGASVPSEARSALDEAMFTPPW
jgi:GNAT superfamily N-acetyltransferase